MYLVTAKEMQQMDQKTIHHTGIPGRILMENAGLGAFRFMCRCFPNIENASVGIIAGRGNNGGDGFVIARYLAQKNIPAKVYLLSKKGRVKGDAKANLDLIKTFNIPLVEIPDPETFKNCKRAMRGHDIYVDAIFGTGLNADVRGYFKDVIQFVNRLGKPVFAVDIPSGLNADTGQVCGVCIKARATATFAYPKIGHMVYPGPEYTGNLHIVDIGIPGSVADEVGPQQFILDKEYLKEVLVPRHPNSHKGKTGHLLAIAGSPGKSGAAAMTAMTAMRVGAGLVTLGVPKSLNPVVESQIIEPMTYALPETADGVLDVSGMEAIKKLMPGKTCLVTGPGIGTAMETKQLFFEMMRTTKIPVVLDADAINIIAENLDALIPLKIPVILTPHPGEMGRLCGLAASDVQKNRINLARQLATRYRAHVVLKGARTVIAHPDGRIYLNLTGNPGMASGGMGDVLTGAIAGFITQGYSPEDAIHLGVYLHGAAADHLSIKIGPIGYLATDVMNQLPSQIRDLSPPKDTHG